MSSKFKNKKILVTGACGTVGSELVRQLLSTEDYGPAEVIGLDNNESQLFFLDQKYLSDKRANFFVHDIRDLAGLTRIMAGIDIVFHCAALKHVVLCERSPDQAVLTNILAVQNVIKAAQENNVERVIFTSSDKAVNPTNVMGTSKLMGERLMTAANSSKRGHGPIFASTRFGNVLGSRGSVIPIFQSQISKGGPVTLTHPDMTRFVMSIEESVRLVIDSAIMAKGGEVFITKMPVVRIKDIALAMISVLAPRYGFMPEDIKILEIGVKPGEKLYEELMSLEETRRAIELQKYFCVLPAFRGMYCDIDYTYDDQISLNVENPYASSQEQPISKLELLKLFERYGLFYNLQIDSENRYWPGDKEQSCS